MNPLNEKIEGLLEAYLTDTITPEDMTALNGWVSACAENAQLFERIREVWFSLSAANRNLVFDSRKGYALKVDKYYAFLLTEDRNLANDIFIPRDMLKGGKNGDKAVVKVVEWPQDAKNPIGKVIDILGQAGDNTTEMHAILAEFGLPYVYPKAVEAAADKISDVITPEDYAEREDFRDITSFNVFPAVVCGYY